MRIMPGVDPTLYTYEGRTITLKTPYAGTKESLQRNILFASAEKKQFCYDVMTIIKGYGPAKSKVFKYPWYMTQPSGKPYAEVYYNSLPSSTQEFFLLGITYQDFLFENIIAAHNANLVMGIYDLPDPAEDMLNDDPDYILPF